MKIFIDIGHPVHVHYFKHFIKIIREKGEEVFLSARNKDITYSLLRHEGLDFYNRGRGATRLLPKAVYLLKTDYRLYKQAKAFDPDLFLSACSPYAAHASALLSKPHISLEDTESGGFNHLVYRPFTDAVLTSSSYKKEFKNQIRFDGYFDLCYLHPRYFSPKKDIQDLLGVKANEKYVVLRFVSWGAVHDRGHVGLPPAFKRRLVEELSRHARAFISSESELPSELKDHEIDIPPYRMHDALAYASLYYGESATMASESAVLGTPAIYHDDDGRGYTFELQDRYGLVYNYTESREDQRKGLEKAVEILKQGDTAAGYQAKRKELLSNSIDVTAFMVWFVEHYPQSKTLMEEEPNMQYRFS